MTCIAVLLGGVMEAEGTISVSLYKGWMALCVCSAAASFVTGHTMTVDGGFVAQ